MVSKDPQKNLSQDPQIKIESAEPQTKLISKDPQIKQDSKDPPVSKVKIPIKSYDDEVPLAANPQKEEEKNFFFKQEKKTFIPESEKKNSEKEVKDLIRGLVNKTKAKWESEKKINDFEVLSELKQIEPFSQNFERTLFTELKLIVSEGNNQSKKEF